MFLADVYGKQKIVRDGIVPIDFIESSDGWRPQMKGIVLPLGKWCHVSVLINHNYIALASSSKSELVAPVRGSFVGPSKLKSELNWNIEIS